MSWHFLQEGEEASWPASSWDGAPSALSSLMPAADPSCSHASATDYSSRSQSGTTCGPSTGVLGAVTSMSSAEGSPVRTSALPASAPASTGSEAASGRTWHASLARWDRGSCSWRTPQLSLLGDSDVFSGTWPAWGTMRTGVCWARTPVAFRITEPACGWLPTPSGVNGGRNNTMGRVDEWGGSSNPLRGTPIGRALSPNFEETVMGWPTDWTARTPLGTARFRQWLASHGARFVAEGDAA